METTNFKDLDFRQRFAFLKACKPVFDEVYDDEITQKEFDKDTKKFKDDGYMFLGSDKRMGVYFKDKDLESLFLKFYGLRSPAKAISMDMYCESDLPAHVGMANCLVQDALRLVNSLQDYSRIYCKTNAPLVITNAFIKVVIAPRLECD